MKTDTEATQPPDQAAAIRAVFVLVKNFVAFASFGAHADWALKVG